MSRLRIALLNAAHDGADTRRNFRRELDADVAEFSVTDGELPETFEYDADEDEPDSLGGECPVKPPVHPQCRCAILPVIGD